LKLFKIKNMQLQGMTKHALQLIQLTEVKMSESKEHRQVARSLAKKEQTDYNSGKGPDILNSRRIIEVETINTVLGGLQQLQGYHKPVYIAGTNKAAVDKALEITKNTTVGVMNRKGNIIKPSTRKRK